MNHVVVIDKISVKESSTRYGVPKRILYDKISTLRKAKRNAETSQILTLMPYKENLEEKVDKAKKIKTLKQAKVKKK